MSERSGPPLWATPVGGLLTLLVGAFLILMTVHVWKPFGADVWGSGGANRAAAALWIAVAGVLTLASWAVRSRWRKGQRPS